MVSTQCFTETSEEIRIENVDLLISTGKFVAKADTRPKFVMNVYSNSVHSDHSSERKCIDIDTQPFDHSCFESQNSWRCVSNVVPLITRLIQFSLLHDDVPCFDHQCFVTTCFRSKKETITFQFICIICVMLLVLCFEMFQNVPDWDRNHQNTQYSQTLKCLRPSLIGAQDVHDQTHVETKNSPTRKEKSRFSKWSSCIYHGKFKDFCMHMFRAPVFGTREIHDKTNRKAKSRKTKNDGNKSWKKGTKT